MKIICYDGGFHKRGRHIAEAMLQGFKRHNVDARAERGGGSVGDLIVAYGWLNAELFDRYRKAGRHFLYVDLGFWDRRPSGARFEGFHKVSLNGWCPTPTMRRGCPDDRFRKLNVDVLPWHSGRNIVIAGMSQKSAHGHGLRAEQWERAAITRIARKSSLPIVYRPKPSWVGARPIPGTQYSNGDVPLAAVLADARVVITHHSNAAIDALCAGAPVYCEKGPASLLSIADFDGIDTPPIPTDAQRMSLLADIAYCQWSPAEMRSGACWDHFRGLL